MTLESLLQSIREELEKNGIQDSVAVNVAFTVNQKSSGELELDCLDSRSRRSEHVHRMKVNVRTSSKPTIPASKAERTSKKSPAPLEEPKRTKELITPPALPKKRKPW